jgi:hypothetical protein
MFLSYRLFIVTYFKIKILNGGNYSAYKNQLIDIDFDETDMSEYYLLKIEKMQSITNNRKKLIFRNLPIEDL